jgi:hypothetical protein
MSRTTVYAFDNSKEINDLTVTDQTSWRGASVGLTFAAGNGCEDGQADLPREEVAKLRDALTVWLLDQGVR